MAHTLPPLPYAAAALEPQLDALTMTIRHGKHHDAYVTNLNAALEKAPELANWTLGDLCRNVAQVPEGVRTAERNNGGGHWNHSLFWELMAPNAGGEPGGDVSAAITKAWGDFASSATRSRPRGLAVLDPAGPGSWLGAMARCASRARPTKTTR